MGTAPVRVLLADDSALMRREIARIIEAAGDLEVVGTARNGTEALQKTKELDPDVVLLDINMPEMDGLSALQRIMLECPKPCVMVSSLTQENAITSFEAMELGAVDVVGKPSGTVSRDIQRVGDEIRFKVRSAAKARLRNLQAGRVRRASARPSVRLNRTVEEAAPVPSAKGIAGRSGINSPASSPFKGSEESGESTLITVGGAPAPEAASLEVDSLTPTATTPRAVASGGASPSRFRRALGGKVVVIGQSTGGPRAIIEVLEALPPDLGAPVIVVQHMPGSFTGGFARRLNALSSLQFKEAESGDVLEPNCGFVAAGDLHLVVAPQPNANRRYLLRTSRWPTGMQHMPSVDVTMRSVLERFGPGTIGVLLTGMGDDGAAAMVEILNAGGRTIAESEETAIVFGMPREAIRLGGAEFVLPSYRIGEKIVELVQQ